MGLWERTSGTLCPPKDAEFQEDEGLELEVPMRVLQHH